MADSIIPLDGNSIYIPETTRTSKSALDKDDFLNLLVAQMKYQDPLEPMSNTESIAQLAQFSALEQMTNIANAQNQSSAYSLVGKYVVGNKYNDSSGVQETYGGVVTAVKQSGSEMFLCIGDVEIPLSGVQTVTDPNSDSLGTINSNIATSQSLALIGKNVQAVITDAEGNLTQFVEGTVDYVKIANGRTILMVNDLEVYAEEVLMVSDEMKLIGKEATAVIKNSDDTTSEVTGKISGIEFKDNKPFVVIDGEKYAISALSDVTEGLNLVGKNVDTSDIKGTVSAMVIKNGEAYVRIGGVDYTVESVKTAMMNQTKDTDKSSSGGSSSTDDSTAEDEEE